MDPVTNLIFGEIDEQKLAVKLERGVHSSNPARKSILNYPMTQVGSSSQVYLLTPLSMILYLSYAQVALS